MCWIFSKLGKWTLVVKGKFSESFFHCKETLIQFQITSTLEVCEVLSCLTNFKGMKRPVRKAGTGWRLFQNGEIFVHLCELDEFDKIVHAWLRFNYSLTQGQKTFQCNG